MNMAKIADPTLLQSYSKQLREYCPQWKNGLIASQYLLPCKTVIRYLSSSSDAHVLDWDCGDGHFSFFLLQLGFTVSAYSFERIGKISSLLEGFKRFNFHHCESKEPILLPYQNKTFDVVFSMGVLEHVQEYHGNELASLKEIHRILKPGGKVFIFHLPNQNSWIEMANRVCVKMKLFKKYTHNFIYRKKQVEELVSLAGFSLLEQGYYNLFPRNILRECPAVIGNNIYAIRLFNVLEKIVSIPLKKFSQNHFFILEKKAS